MPDPLPYRFVRLLGLVLCTAAYPAAAQQVVYVDVNATGQTWDGATWCTAYRDLQDALATANPGDAIRVAGGIYRPDRGTGDRTANFPLLNGVALYGGFAGCGAADPDAHNLALYETILSGDLIGDDGPAFTNRDDNSYHVVTYDDPNATGVVLDGFTVSGGNADGTGSATTNQGSGIHIRNGTIKCFPGGPTIRNCIIEDNWAAHHGAVNDHAAASVIENCTFRDNFAGQQAGGLLIHNGNATVVRNCTFERNVTDNEGGGVWTGQDDDPTCVPSPAPAFTGCRFAHNRGHNGGGFFASSFSQPVLSDCSFDGNVAEFQGGGLHLALGPIAIDNTSFLNNTAGTDANLAGGGGVWLNTREEPGAVFTDCEFRGNTGRTGGGVLSKAGGSFRVIRGRFEDNVAYQGGGIWYGGIAVVTDSTFLRNEAEHVGGGLTGDRTGELTLSRSSFIQNAVVRDTPGGGGGGIGMYGGSATITNCWFIGNFFGDLTQPFSSFGGGGIFVNADARVAINNCTFLGNFAPRGGGACFTNGAEVHVANCTFAQNAAVVDGDGITEWNSFLTVINSILWDDRADGSGIELYISDRQPVRMEYNCIQGGWSGTGNFDADPRFLDALGPDGIPGTSDDDIRLSIDSPCVGAGDNSSVPQDTTDLDGDGDTSEPLPVDLAGNPRIVGAFVDMGALERQDCNENGIDDTLDILAGTSEDCDGNGVPDECDSDCNGNGVADACESDRDGDGSIDDCDLCPNDGWKTAPGLCGCGVSDDDSDDDTVPDCNDVCPGADDRLDSDGDGVPNGCDSCNGADDTLDCNHNGYVDPCEVLDGVAPDLDANGVPDDCDIMPHTAGEGCRALGVTPAPTGEPMALRLTSQDFPCLDQFLAADGGLTDSPVFLTSDEWGLVIVAHEQIIPSTRYSVAAELAGGAVSAQSWITTPPWGDVVGNGPGALPDGNVNFSDIGAVVDCFKQVLTAPPLHRCDIWPAAPDGVVNFSDIGAAVEGFKSLPYPYAGPCP